MWILFVFDIYLLSGGKEVIATEMRERFSAMIFIKDRIEQYKLHAGGSPLLLLSITKAVFFSSCILVSSREHSSKGDIDVLFNALKTSLLGIHWVNHLPGGLIDYSS